MSAATMKLDATALEQRYALFDRLPQKLLTSVVAFPAGTLLERVAAVVAWRDALLEGRLPATLAPPWPTGVAVGARLGETLTSLGLLRFCRSEPELVDALLLDALGVSAEAQLAKVRWELAELERLRNAVRPVKRIKGIRVYGTVRRGMFADPVASILPSTPEAAQARALQLEAARAHAEAKALSFVADRLQSNWEARVRAWLELETVFGELGNFVSWGWDLTRGILHSTGWTELVRLRALLEKLPNLRELVRVLGRMRCGASTDVCAMEQVIVPLRRAREELVRRPTPFVPSEARGVEKSGDIARMLPSEAVLLTRPVLRLLWHARRAERALASYRFDGEEFVSTQTEGEGTEVTGRPRPSDERGPIIACIDTSGSMEGLPERVAKALVLEALRVAAAEGRACYLIAFSGPGQIVEYELTVSPTGLPALLGFLTGSFGGGTDVEAPLRRATELLRREKWSRADLLVVSDGEFEVGRLVIDRLERARSTLALRVHGVLIGQGSPSAMSRVCSHIHHFSEWSAFISPTVRSRASEPT